MCTYWAAYSGRFVLQHHRQTSRMFFTLKHNRLTDESSFETTAAPFTKKREGRLAKIACTNCRMSKVRTFLKPPFCARAGLTCMNVVKMLWRIARLPTVSGQETQMPVSRKPKTKSSITTITTRSASSKDIAASTASANRNK